MGDYRHLSLELSTVTEGPGLEDDAQGGPFARLLARRPGETLAAAATRKSDEAGDASPHRDLIAQMQ